VIIRISEAKGSPKRQKELITHINGKFNDINSAGETESESESHVTTDGQSASLSWYKAPIRGLRPDFVSVRNTEYI
jgi:hypothetical protein